MDQNSLGLGLGGGGVVLRGIYSEPGSFRGLIRLGPVLTVFFFFRI